MEVDKANHVGKNDNTLVSRLITTSFDMRNIDVCQQNLEALPNEVFFLFFSYLNQSDVVRAFFNLNQRIDSIVLESVRYLNLPENTEFTWFDKYIPYIGTQIEMITCHVGSVLCLFPSNYLYPNLHTVILLSHRFRVGLNVKARSPFNTIVSCLNILRLCGFWRNDDIEHPLLLKRNITMESQEKRISALLKSTLCLEMQHISLVVDDEQMWVYLCNLTPNLNYICIKHGETDDVQYMHSAITPSVTRLECLTRLHIDFYAYDTDFMALRWLIESCHLTLQEFQLTSDSSSPVNGRFLEELLQPCRHLKTLSFFIQTDERVQTDIVEQLCHFQSKWWLDECRPPVLVHSNGQNRFTFASIPCIQRSFYLIELPADPKMWLLNKEHIDPSRFYFTKPGIEDLTFDYWGFSSPHILFKQLISQTTKKTEVLPSLKHLCINLSKCDGPRGVTLMIWLLLAPNIEKLILKEMTIENQLNLAVELSELLTIYPFLRSTCGRLDQVTLFYASYTNVPQIQQKLFILFSAIFPKAIDCIRKSIFPVISDSSIIQGSTPSGRRYLGCPCR
ncbi:unnamed protein product [Rotaria socialis]|uniref:F-box domain-containing protein n=1 Tax=Rotaria socialis TaxID=392032 RepID=A0A821S6L8_9BILA|nr:unnamed protein product [Rotaria socialis]